MEKKVIFDGSTDTYRKALYQKAIINDIRNDDSLEDSWEENDEVIEAIEEIEKLGFFYDEDSWDIFPNEEDDEE